MACTCVVVDILDIELYSVIPSLYSAALTNPVLNSFSINGKVSVRSNGKQNREQVLIC